MPPTLTARPSVMPEARPTRFGRYCCPRTTIGLYVRFRAAPRTMRQRIPRMELSVHARMSAAGNARRKPKRTKVR